MNLFTLGNGVSMAGPTIARNYSEVSNLITSHQNAIFEVNVDGSIRTQSLKEKIGNLGLRITGKFSATKAEKDAKVAEAIRNLYHKAGNTDEGYFHPKSNKDYARFFNPQSLVKRTASKEIKGKVGTTYVQAIHTSQVTESQKVPAQKIFLGALADAFTKLSIDSQYRQDAQVLEGLATTYRTAGRYVKEDNIDSTLSQLKEDLKGVGLELGKGPLENFNISKGVVDWVKRNSVSGDLDRYS
jgi:hypothetical protein